jgi:hypothetical protein
LKEDESRSPLDKGRLFGTKIIAQWLSVTTDDDDFVICDGGIDIAYLKHSDLDDDDGNSEEGDTYYIVQSKSLS